MSSAKSDGKKGCRVRLCPGRNCTLVAIILSLGAAPTLAQFVEAQKLAVSDETAAEWFGRSVSVSGNTAVVGEAYDSCGAGLRCGSVHVLRFNGTSWVAEQKLTASDAEAGAAFGTSVSLSGDTVVVGALNDDCVAGRDCGSAYAFRFNGTSWVEEQKLTASDVDGDTDVLSASSFDNKIAWYESGGGSPPTFTERVISTTASLARSVFATDVDGDTDVLSASQTDNKIAWYQSDGGSPPTFTERIISTAAYLARFGFAPSCFGIAAHRGNP